MSEHQCPKCKYSMETGRRLASFTTEVSLVKEGNLVGDNILAFYCPNCGYMNCTERSFHEE